MTHLHAPFSSHLAGNCSAIRTAHYYKRCKKITVFCIKIAQISHRFLFDFRFKIDAKMQYFPVFLENLRNILQNKILRVLQTAPVITSGTVATPHNLLTCKILTKRNKKNEKKAQKLMQNFTRFSH